MESLLQMNVLRWILVSGAVLLVGCAQQQIRDDAQSQLKQGQYELALRTLEAGVERYPDSPLLRGGLVSTQNDVATRMSLEATQARMQGRLDQAGDILVRAAMLLPTNERVRDMQAELLREKASQQALMKARKQIAAKDKVAALSTLDDALAAHPRQPELVALQRELAAEVRLSSVTARELRLKSGQPISLDFRNASLASLLEAIRLGTGVNFVIDREVQMDQRASVFIKDAHSEDAIDLTLAVFQLARRIVDSKTVLIYPNTPEKRKEHQDQIIRVFYLTNANAKTTSAMLQSMLRIQAPFVDENANMLAVRESPELIALTERLVALHDQGAGEVMLEMEVLEVKTARLTELGVNFPNSFSLSLLPGTGQNGLTLDSFNSLNLRGGLNGLNYGQVGLSVGGLLVNLRREVGDFNTLANPKIRARSREKATILIGDKVPIITTTAGGNGGFVSENVSYQDVGLKLEVEPVVSPDDEVTIKLALEVSTLAREVRTTGGSVAYQIGTRNASTTLRLRDGETQLLGGLISKEDRSSANRVPGLGDLPIAGRLFSSQKDDLQRTELVLAITPHILRGAAHADPEQAEMWVGTENFTRLRRARLTSEAAEPVGAQLPMGGLKAPAGGAALSPTVQASPGTGPQAGESERISLSFGEARSVKVGDQVDIALHIKAGVPLKAIPMGLQFDVERLQVIAVGEGGFFKQSEAPVSFTHAVNAKDGRISVGLLSNAQAGVAGEGELLTIRFKALQPGTAKVLVLNANISGPDGVLTIEDTAPLSIQVQ